MTIQHGPTNGWNPLASPNGTTILCGTGTSRLVDPITGAVQEVGDGWPAGWLDVAYVTKPVAVNPDRNLLRAVNVQPGTVYDATTIRVGRGHVIRWQTTPTDRDNYYCDDVLIPLDRPAKGFVTDGKWLLVDDPTDGYRSRLIDVETGAVLRVLDEKANDAIVRELDGYGPVVFYNSPQGPKLNTASGSLVVANCGLPEGRGDVCLVPGDGLFAWTSAYGGSQHPYYAIGRRPAETSGICIPIPANMLQAHYDAVLQSFTLCGVNTGEPLDGWGNGQLAIVTDVPLDAPREHLTPAPPVEPTPDPPLWELPPVIACQPTIIGHVIETGKEARYPLVGNSSWSDAPQYPRNWFCTEMLDIIPQWTTGGRPLSHGLVTTEIPGFTDADLDRQIAATKAAGASAIYAHVDNEGQRPIAERWAGYINARGLLGFLGWHITGHRIPQPTGDYGINLNIRDINWHDWSERRKAVVDVFTWMAADSGRPQCVYIFGWPDCTDADLKTFITACAKIEPPRRRPGEPIVVIPPQPEHPPVTPPQPPKLGFWAWLALAIRRWGKRR